MDVKCLYKPSLYQLSVKTQAQLSDEFPESLLDIAAKQIVLDAGNTLMALQVKFHNF